MKIERKEKPSALFGDLAFGTNFWLDGVEMHKVRGVCGDMPLAASSDRLHHIAADCVVQLAGPQVVKTVNIYDVKPGTVIEFPKCGTIAIVSENAVEKIHVSVTALNKEKVNMNFENYTQVIVHPDANLVI